MPWLSWELSRSLWDLRFTDRPKRFSSCMHSRPLHIWLLSLSYHTCMTRKATIWEASMIAGFLAIQPKRAITTTMVEWLQPGPLDSDWLRSFGDGAEARTKAKCTMTPRRLMWMKSTLRMSRATVVGGISF